jgi:hypothetical protein
MRSSALERWRCLPAETPREEYFEALRDAVTEYYLADPSNPYQQSGRSSGAERWEATRRCLVKAIHGEVRMEYTEGQKASFKQEFAARRKRQVILAVPLVIFIGFAVLADQRNGGPVLGIPAAVFGPAFLALVVVALAFSFRNWRCPACDKYLGKGISPHFCPKCGVALQ